MRKINTNTHLATKHLFDVKIDTNKLYFEAVEQEEYEHYKRSCGGGCKTKK